MKQLYFFTIAFFLSLAGFAQTDSIEHKVNALVQKMSLDEKVGQLCLKGTSSRSKGLSDELKDQVRKGLVGAILNLTDTALVLQIQKIAVEESPNHIPLLFGRDVIHGYKTIFPIPLGLAASWDTTLIEKTSEIAANESYSRCINWTFAPMVDICRDPRWGRIAESPGEDPYLASIFAKAYINGFQGNNLAEPGRILACAKHFAAYGAAEGGRDYNTVSISQNTLRNIYLKPFKSSVDAGAATFMTSFNDLNGIPASGNTFLLKDVLRTEWKFRGFVVSDWNSVTEMIPHGYCTDEKDAALKAASAGLDMEMTSQAYAHHLKTLIAENKITIAELDEMVKNILRIKFRAGIFENPYFEGREKFALLDPASLALAKSAAIKSFVLLKNEKNILPLTVQKKIAVIGPLANAPKEQLGTWIFDGNKNDSQTPLTALRNMYGTENINYVSGLTYSRDESQAIFDQAYKAAKKSEVVLFFAGEEAILSGEAHSRADIRLPGAQEELIKRLYKAGKPIVLIIMAGRPIVIEHLLPYISAVVMAWHPGTMAGPALADVLSGKENFSGKLPVTWPKTVGQIPIYYNHTNTGRPADSTSFVGIKDIPIEAWQSSLGNTSHYLDAGYTPQYPFGYGLSYTRFTYAKTTIEKNTLTKVDSLIVTTTVTNTGNRIGTETVQLYVQDVTASLVRPVRELKAFAQVELKAGETKTVRFAIAVSELGFYNNEGIYLIEPGTFNLWVSANAADGFKQSFEVK
ncbi:beta-glucosidase BglX [Cytophaga aurantiaca]|uniref:beta-glucosidase BglX n=1 Tax=Cytophaga aurantiaca TaxID=29530 RepID=UPI000372605D|nr:beta-glucosidase BglX [Cytophaga aurantiaca]